MIVTAAATVFLLMVLGPALLRLVGAVFFVYLLTLALYVGAAVMVGVVLFYFGKGVVQGWKEGWAA